MENLPLNYNDIIIYENNSQGYFMKLSNLSPQQAEQLHINMFECFVVHQYIFNVGGLILFILSYIQYFFKLTIIPAQFNVFQSFIPNIRYLIDIQEYHLASMHAIFLIGLGLMLIRFYTVYPFNLKIFFIMENKKFFLLKIYIIMLALIFIIVSQWITMEHAYQTCPNSTATIDRACPSRATPSDSFIHHIYTLGTVFIAIWGTTLFSFLIPKEFVEKYGFELSDNSQKYGSPFNYFGTDGSQKVEIIKRKLGGWF